MAKLTNRQCQLARAEGKDVFLSDSGGLYLRVRPGKASVKTWLFRFKRLNGSGSRWLEIGTYPAKSLAQARVEAAELSLKRRAGVDPIEERGAVEAAANREADMVKAAEAARITVQQLFERWAETDLIRHKDSGQHVKDTMRRHVLPHLGTLLVEDVRKGHITTVTDKLLAAGKQRTAKVCLSLTRQMFRFAVDRDLIEFDPTGAIRKSKVGGRDTERDRVLSDAEIKALNAQLPDAGLKETTELALWLVLASGCRIGELLAARWADVDLENWTWRIPETKNGRPHTVFLSEFAAQKFTDLKNMADERRSRAKERGEVAKGLEWVFPNRGGSDHVCPKTVTKQLGDRQRTGLSPMSGRAGSRARRKREVKVEDAAKTAESLVLSGGKWTPHDLRRSAATIMVALGVLPEVAEKCLNHTEENKVKRIYQRHSYEAEMRAAWRLLGERLALLTGDAANVLTFSRSA